MARGLALEGGRAGGVHGRPAPEIVHLREHVGTGGGCREEDGRKHTDGCDRPMGRPQQPAPDAGGAQSKFEGFDMQSNFPNSHVQAPGR